MIDKQLNVGGCVDIQTLKAQLSFLLYSYIVQYKHYYSYKNTYFS